MSEKLNSKIAVIGIDIGKNSFHIVGQDWRGALVLRQKWSRGQVEARLANLPPCLIGMEACTGAHHLSRKLQALGHDARLMPAKYVRPYCKGDKNDYRDAEAIAEAVQRPTMKFVGCAKGCASCGPSCQASWRSAPTCSRLACYASSRTFPETGAGWISASRISPARSWR
jgi:transposase